MLSVRKVISGTFLPFSIAYDLIELYVYFLLVLTWLVAVFLGFSAPCASSNCDFDDSQEEYCSYEDEAMFQQNSNSMIVPPVREAIEDPSEVDEPRDHDPNTDGVATAPTTHDGIHLEVPLVISEDASEQACQLEFASNNGSDMSISSLSSIEIVDTPSPSPGGSKRSDREASRDVSSGQLRPLLLSVQPVEQRATRIPSLRVDAPAFVPASISSSSTSTQGRHASGSENVPPPPSAYWNPPPNSAIPVISVPYKRPRRRGGRAPVMGEREVRERATRVGTKALQHVNI